VCNLVLEQEKACKGGLYCSYIPFKLHKDIWPFHLYTSRIMLLKAKDYVRQSFTGHIPKAVPRDLAASLVMCHQPPGLFAAQNTADLCTGIYTHMCSDKLLPARSTQMVSSLMYEFTDIALPKMLLAAPLNY